MYNGPSDREDDDDIGSNNNGHIGEKYAVETQPRQAAAGSSHVENCIQDEFDAVNDVHSDDTIRDPNSEAPLDIESGTNIYTSDDESDTDVESNISDDIDLEEEDRNVLVERRAQFTETRDGLSMRKGNCVFLMTCRGEPCDEGGKDLQLCNKLPNFAATALGRARVQKSGNRYYIGLAIKETLRIPLDKEILIEAFRCLLEVTREVALNSFIISKTPQINDIEWKEIKLYLKQVFSDIPCQIEICKQLVRIPAENERIDIIREYHASAINGHKSVTKTYNRIRQNYYWENMKVQIQQYISGCMECGIKKSECLTARNP